MLWIVIGREEDDQSNGSSQSFAYGRGWLQPSEVSHLKPLVESLLGIVLAYDAIQNTNQKASDNPGVGSRLLTCLQRCDVRLPGRYRHALGLQCDEGLGQGRSGGFVHIGPVSEYHDVYVGNGRLRRRGLQALEDEALPWPRPRLYHRMRVSLAGVFFRDIDVALDCTHKPFRREESLWT